MSVGTAFNLSNAADAFKTLFSPKEAAVLCEEEAPLWSMIPKVDDFYGNGNYIYSLYLTNPQGRSGTYATARANSTAGVYEQFTMPRRADFARVLVDYEALVAAEKDVGAFLKVKKAQMEGALRELGRSINLQLYGDGSGVRFRASNVSSATVTLATVDDIYKIEVGQKLVSSAAADGTGIKSGSITVATINEAAGTFTCSEATVATGIPTVATTDYFYVEGDPTARFMGLKGHLPLSVSATAFYGVDRTTHAEKLAGVRWTSSSSPASTTYSIKEALVTFYNKVRRRGGQPSHIFISWDRYNDLCNQLGSQVIFDKVTSPIGIAFDAINLNGVKVVPDHSCDVDRAYFLDLKTWEFHHMKPAPHLITIDGPGGRQDGDTLALELQWAAYGNMLCRAPRFNGVVELATS